MQFLGINSMATQINKRIVALIAGTGTTLQSVLDAMRWETLGGQIVAVVSHERYSYGLLRAEQAQIPAFVHDVSDFRYSGEGEEGFNQGLIDLVKPFHPDLIVLAGWQLPLSDSFFQTFPNQVVNLQVGLPGQFPTFDPYGSNPVSRAFEAFTAGQIRETHFSMQVLQTSDGQGKTLGQIVVPIYDFDNLVDLEERMTRAQQELLVNTLRLVLREN
jgi:folate-dependent phosphoribosylglycinamide formyltransferase PurN